jgi:PAS domain S-box-containing protein
MATVLVVDDVAANRELVAMLLGYRGHEVIEARDGLSGLNLARTSHPDVVVSDVLMPGVDGLELVHRLRSDPDCRVARVPVIFYTANYLEPETRPIAEAYRVSRFVLRSADPRELLDAVDEVLRDGPVDVAAQPSAEFARAHTQTVNAKLIENMRELRRTERRFEVMATASPVGIVLLDDEGTVTYVNPRLTEITGRPAAELAGTGWLVCLEPSTHAEALAAVRRRSGEPIEHRYRTRIMHTDGQPRWLRVHLRPIRDTEADMVGAIVMVDDVTDVVAAEERVVAETRRRQEDARQRDAERLDSLRRVAGGMAHDFNNLLGSMLGFLHLGIESVREQKEAGHVDPSTMDALLDDLGQVAKGGERAARLTEQLLAFGRREIQQPERVDLGTFLRAAEAGLAESAGESIVLDLRPAAVPAVAIDVGALRRLLQILVQNAAEAMPAGGSITIELSATPDTVTIAVSDVGTGMSAEVRRQAFEPFYSTKSGNRSAGLGLSTAHGIVTQAGGEITISSVEGAGTTVVVTLPAVEREEAPAARTRQTPAPGNPGQETVLLVDDEDDLRAVTARFIKKAGYRVLTASDGNAALKLVEGCGERIHCLVTDVVMPGMDGRQLAQRFLGLCPDAKVVFISGYAEALIDDQGRSLEPNGIVIGKPYSSGQLNEAIASAIAMV